MDHDAPATELADVTHVTPEDRIAGLGKLAEGALLLVDAAKAFELGMRTTGAILVGRAAEATSEGVRLLGVSAIVTGVDLASGPDWTGEVKATHCACGHLWSERPDGCDCLVPTRGEL